MSLKFMKQDGKWQMSVNLSDCQYKIALYWSGKETFDAFGFFWTDDILNTPVGVESEGRRGYHFLHSSILNITIWENGP